MKQNIESQIGSGSTSSHEVMERVKRLRAIHALNRFFHILTFSLAADLALVAIAIVLFKFSGSKLGFPRFFELLLIVLLLREVPRLKMEKFCIYLDQRFALKDRIYSLFWYLVPGRTPDGIIDAHARDCLISVDYEKMNKAVRIQVPKFLPFLVFLFILTLYLSWNTEYRPPGITSRVVITTLTPSEQEVRTTRKESSAEMDKAADQESPDIRNGGHEEPGADNKGGIDDSKTGDPQQPGTEMDEPETGVAGVSPGGAGPGGEEGSGGPSQAELVAPETIDSIPVTDRVSPPVPARLDPEAENSFESLPEAREFLSLIPGQGEAGVADIDQSVIENFRSLIDNYPPAYREQLETYYGELIK